MTGPVGLAVAERIRLLRLRRGLSLRAFADAVREAGWDVSYASLSVVERGLRPISVDGLAAVAVVLGTTPVRLLQPPDECAVCGGVPPAGFSCLVCGTEAES